MNNIQCNDNIDSSMYSYKPRGTLARTIYYKQLSDRYISQIDRSTVSFHFCLQQNNFRLSLTTCSSYTACTMQVRFQVVPCSWIIFSIRDFFLFQYFDFRIIFRVYRWYVRLSWFISNSFSLHDFFVRYDYFRCYHFAKRVDFLANYGRINHFFQNSKVTIAGQFSVYVKRSDDTQRRLPVRSISEVWFSMN